MFPKDFKIDGRYRYLKSLGEGLSGQVLLVEDSDGKKALKFLKRVQLNVSRDEALENFKREFSILKELNHPNIARILDFGFDRKIEKYFFTTEFVEGRDLATACDGINLEQKEKLIVQVLRALGYLHNRRIYHFDIKPQNILVAYENGQPVRAKIIDFGLAGFTSSRKKVGTPAFMSPEVVQGAHLDGRADLYSLGVLIYQVLTGTNPFNAGDLRQILKHQLYLVPVQPSRVVAGLPEYWDHIVMRLLEKKPAHRYSQASLVIRDLNFLSQKSFEIETEDTKLSYLPESGTLIGREKEWLTFTGLFERIFLNGAGEAHLFMILGDQGTGKSRMVSEIKYFSQLRNIPVLTLRQYRETAELSPSFVLVIDDDSMTEDDVNALFREVSGRTCLVVWTTEGESRNWENTTSVELKPYSKLQLKNYIESVTGLSDAPQGLIDEIYSRTSGNPLFVTGFIKALLEENLLFDESGKWDSTTFQDLSIDFSRLKIPDTIEEHYSGYYQAQDPANQDLLAWFAVNGEALPIRSLEKIVKLENSDNLVRRLVDLVAKTMIVKTSREATYWLSNPLMAPVIVKQLPDGELERRHDILAGIHEQDADRMPYWRHLAHGSDFSARQKALRELGRIHTDAERHVDAAECYLSLSESLKREFPSRECLEAVQGYARALIASGDYKIACETLEEAVRGLQKFNMPLFEKYFELLDLLLGAFFKSNNYDRVRLYLDLLTPDVKALPDRPESLICRNYAGFLDFHEGRHDEAEEIFLSTHAAWQKLKPADQERVINNRIIDVYLFRGKLKEAVRFCQQSIQVFERTQNRFKLASMHYALGDLYYRLLPESKNGEGLDYSQLCLDEFLACEKIAREIHHQQLLYSAFNGVGNLYYHSDNYPDALGYYQRALAVARSAKEFNLAAILSHNISNTYKKMGQWQDAYAHMVYAINTLESVENKNAYLFTMLSASYLELAELHLSKQDADRAMDVLNKVEDLLGRHDFLKDHAFTLKLFLTRIHYLKKDPVKQRLCFDEAGQLADTPAKKQELKELIDSMQPPGSTGPARQQPGEPMNTSPATNALDDLERIIEINNMINSEHNIEQLFKMVLNYALELTNAELGFVILIENDDIEQLKISAGVNASASDEEKISMSIVRSAIESGEMVSSADAIQDDRFDSSQSVILNDLKSVLCLPILSKNKCVGVFYLDNRFKTSAFENTNIMVLRAFCDQVGIALDNARLISELKQAKLDLENRLTRTEEELAEVRQILGEEAGQYRSRYSYENIISQSKPMQEVFRLIDKVTETNLSIFIQGESGTGKELIAKALHYNNPQRKERRFVAVNCGAIPQNLMESELFGHKAGSFTGATRDKKGLFEEAGGGTLFLDEIGELPLELQVKLLRVLQEGEVQRIGENHPVKVNVRVLSASHRDIEGMMRERAFREDLYYRLCQMKVTLPPLSERKEDIPLLSRHFIKKYRTQNQIKDNLDIPPDFMKALLEYGWPGNIRELENLISVACALAENGRLNLCNLPSHYKIAQRQEGTSVLASDVAGSGGASLSTVRIDEQNAFDPAKTWRDYEALVIAKCYESSEGRKKTVAEKLGLSHSTVYKKIEDMNLDDRMNPLYADPFLYDGHSSMESYLKKIFQASLTHHENRPYAAIRQLGVSQGYFYKVMKKVKEEEGLTRFESQ